MFRKSSYWNYTIGLSKLKSVTKITLVLNLQKERDKFIDTFDQCINNACNFYCWQSYKQVDTIWVISVGDQNSQQQIIKTSLLHFRGFP